MLHGVTLCILQSYEEYYEAEESINTQLNVFAVNMKTAYGGINDVQTQIGYSSKKGKELFTWVFKRLPNDYISYWFKFKALVVDKCG